VTKPKTEFSAHAAHHREVRVDAAPLLVVGSGFALAPQADMASRCIVKEDPRALPLWALGQANAVHELAAGAASLLLVDGQDVENRLRLG
jgi:hypothetical protein